jgi:zona occludens toxin
MSINVYTGTVGSGKSYHALCEGLEKVTLRGSFVISNFPIHAKSEKEKNRWIYKDEFEPEDLIKLSFERGIYGKEGKGLVLIDEAGVWFNSRDWQIAGDRRKEWVKFFSQSRKFGYDVIMVAQDMRMLDRQIRSLAEYEVKHVKLKNYKWMKWLPVQVFACIYHWSGGAFKGQLQLKVLNPWKAKKYNSMKLFKMSDEVLQLASKYGFALEEKDSEQGEGSGVPSPVDVLSREEKKKKKSKLFSFSKKKKVV